MSNWKTKLIGELVMFKKGKIAEQSEIHREGYLPLINTNAVSGKEIIWANPNGVITCSEEDILMLWDGERSGLVAIGLNGVVGSTFSKLSILSEIHNLYLYYFLKDKFKWIQNQRTGTGVPHVPKDLHKILKISYPKSIYQIKIAKILNTIDAVIEKTEQSIAKYQAIKKGMMQDLFTRGIDLNTGKLRPSFEEAPELYKESELGMIPKEWEIENLHQVCDVRVSNVDKKIYPNKTIVRLCNYMDAYNNDFITNGLNFSEGSANTNELSRFSLKKEDVIITKDSETPDDIAIPSVVYENLNNVVCGYHLAILRPNIEKISGIFLMYYLKLSNVQRYFFKIASGSTRYGLTIGGIQSTWISYPFTKEQKEITKRLIRIDNLIKKEQKILAKHQKIKKGLMQDLLTGKVEVRV